MVSYLQRCYEIAIPVVPLIRLLNPQPTLTRPQGRESGDGMNSYKPLLPSAAPAPPHESPLNNHRRQKSMELPFETYDVFTDTPYRGNPLAVVTIPVTIPAPPTQAQKQAVAREFNLSETIFIHEPASPSSVRHVDIFVTNAEIPFAGHPTIGTAVSLLGAGVDTLVTKAGPIPVASTGGGGGARATIPHNVHLHAKRLRDLSSPAHLEGLSDVPAVRAAELDAPVYSIVRGMSFILIELPSLAVLAQATESRFTGPVAELLDDGWRAGLCCRFYYVRTGGGADDDGTEVVTLRTRMIDALCEDPATGSASAALCCYLGAASGGQKTSRRRYELTQGVEMGRESNIVVHVTMKGNAIDEVHLSGKAVKVMKGTLII
ncbi:phenazine biosynthesis protein, putative [Cordyceps militaris CM01]|uniref:Phenazine biosynthesis protein, putative n=1 Tax=Cordyceps militaris (strain CM01) TaxID=983644 RepID=G3JFC8_CORMM|nr:phenazine biosynthesis protein, putative [Cordyceps militaris CM01]EGX93118.1 phenazine biosynthesis protein, putative [Cordyceps militaris CM01]